MDDLKKQIIITGAAGTGKSTLLDALKINGVFCIDEVSRNVIDRELSVGGDALPWRDTMKFVRNCISVTEKNIRHITRVAISDRSMLDHNVYLKVRDIQIPPALVNFPYTDHYHKSVFYCPLWEEIYVQEVQRPEPFMYQNEIDKCTREIYKERGFELIEIPKISVEKRVEFVLNHLSSFPSDVFIGRIPQVLF